MNSTTHVISQCGMEQNPYDVFLRNICQFVTKGVPSGRKKIKKRKKKE
jgi:hypothetical protein